MPVRLSLDRGQRFLCNTRARAYLRNMALARWQVVDRDQSAPSSAFRLPSSGRDRQADQRIGGPVECVEITAAVDQPGELRLADRDPRRDRADAAHLLL